ncbi:hypothetical protein B0J14DRAFT_53319 [Halenospora varia]|nr:hypothetical protein B0J14DRAFT_53319 [Halenospora varia]
MRIPIYIRAGHPHVPAPIPKAGLVMSAVLSIVTVSVLLVCLGNQFFSPRIQHFGPRTKVNVVRRILGVWKLSWSNIPLVRYLIFVIYLDSLLFIITTAILFWAYGLNKTLPICTTAIYLCLICYMSTKIFIYYFLVEKVYIVRSIKTPRLKSKLYLFNCFGMLLPYTVIVIFNFIYRIAYLNDDGVCIIGMKFKVLMPLIIFDAAINLYLTVLFVVPLRSLYSYKHNPDSMLRTIALRSFIGSCGTLASSIVNLTILMVLHGEAAWICLMCCNADILFSVLMLHWVTSKDSTGGSAIDSVRTPADLAQPHSSSFKAKLKTPFSHDRIDSPKHPKGWDWGTGKITTEIRAGREEVELDEITQNKEGISVKIGHSVVVESKDDDRVWSSTSAKSVNGGSIAASAKDSADAVGEVSDLKRASERNDSMEKLVENALQKLEM